MSKQELESKVFEHLDTLNRSNQLNIGGMVMALTMSVDPEYKKLNWSDMNNYAKLWMKKRYFKNAKGDNNEETPNREPSKES